MPLLISALSLSALHLVIDSIKFLVSKKEQNAAVYITDQLIHLICIAAVSFILTNYELKLLPFINDFLSALTPDIKALFGWVCPILLVLKPANITIKQLVSKYKPPVPDSANNAGAFIGALERIIILLFLSVGQYAAIGLVLTAKSIARYDKISKDQQFAEYYLLGTLLSTLFAILIFFAFY